MTDRAALRIVADENIPLAAAAFAAFGEVQCVPATAITPALVRDADVLLVRSVTRVDEALTAGSRLRFVGSATIGADHVDTALLARHGIVFRHAPGSNAESVVEYVLAALLTLAVRTGEPLRGKQVGIIGCGNIGSRLARRLPALGVRVLQNDPPLADLAADRERRAHENVQLADAAERERRAHEYVPLAGAAQAERERRAHEYVPLARVLAECDVITCHVPLTATAPHPTRHLIGDRELAQLRKDAWLLNTSRGAVISNAALLAALQAGALAHAVLDVWEGEPEPAAALLQLSSLATPHIAGYSWDGKVAGTLMLRDALVQTLGPAPAQGAATALPVSPDERLAPAWDAAAALAASPDERLAPAWDAAAALAASPVDRLALEPPPRALPEPQWLHALARQLYDIEADDARMRTLLSLPESSRAARFRELRRTYPRRRAFQRHVLADAGIPDALRTAVREGLRVSEGASS